MMTPDAQDTALVRSFMVKKPGATIQDVINGTGLSKGLALRAIWCLRQEGTIKGWPK